jgi:hypothetical protein
VVPSSVLRESTTRLSLCRQNGQCIAVDLLARLGGGSWGSFGVVPGRAAVLVDRGLWTDLGITWG